MHIAFFVHNIHLGGGGERVTVNLANAMLTRGNKVTIISMTSPDIQKPIFNLNPDAELFYLNVQFKSNLVEKIVSCLRMNRFVEGKKYDVILGVGNYPSLLLSLLFTNKYSRKIGCMHLSFSAVPKGWALLAKIFFRRLTALVSLTQFDYNTLKKLNDTVFVIPNSTSFNTERQAPLNNKIVLALGRFAKEKDFATMIRLFGKFCATTQDWKLRIRGDGPLKSELIQQIETNNLSSYIELLPPTADVESEYMQASVVLLTSRYEGLPMVLIEAQTFGVPVISFDCETGPAEIIQHGMSGYLIDPDRKEDLVDRLVELTSDENLRKKMGQQAKVNAQRFSEETIVEQWNSLFKALVKKR